MQLEACIEEIKNAGETGQKTQQVQLESKMSQILDESQRKSKTIFSL